MSSKEYSLHQKLKRNSLSPSNLQVPQTHSPSPMCFWDHIEDLRKTLLKCTLSLIISFCIVGCFFPFFSQILNRPLQQALLDHPNLIQSLVTNSPMGVFSVLLQFFFMGGLALSFPAILFFIAQFITPALNQKEKYILLPGCLAIFGLFALGALFSYFFLLPLTLKIAIQLNTIFGFQLIWSAPHYYGLVVWMTLGVGLCFEFPVAIILASLLGLITSQQLITWRKIMFTLLLILSALITPGGDPFSLFILTLPLYLLYEAAILICKKIDQKRIVEN
jgi:sec-independent protein translocase protein TatC